MVGQVGDDEPEWCTSLAVRLDAGEVEPDVRAFGRDEQVLISSWR